MELFLPTLEQMGFLFIFIAIGFILVKVKVLPSTASGILARLENSIFIPALVLSTFAKNFTVEISLTTGWFWLQA
jgi:predicted permease